MKNKKTQRECMPVHERVLRRTKIPLDKSQCWEWQGPVNNAGYGMIKGDSGKIDDPKMMTVHRAVARFYCFPIDDVEVQHTCLNKRCVNPKHLVKGDLTSRYKRMKKKYGHYWQKPKDPYKTCEHCGGTAHIVWFNRKHGTCYPGMITEYTKLLHDQA